MEMVLLDSLEDTKCEMVIHVSELFCFSCTQVIDEAFKVLHLVKFTKIPPPTHELLQELRDLSSMAMEHFDEKIVPDLKKKSGVEVRPSNLGNHTLSSES